MENIMIDSANADLKKKKVSKKEKERLLKEEEMNAFVEEETEKISKDKKEMELETMIFGGDDERIKNTLDFIGHEFSDDEAEKFAKIYEFSDEDNDEIFGNNDIIIDTNKYTSLDFEELEEGVKGEDGMEVDNEKQKIEMTPAWIDDDDDTLEINLTSINRTKKLRETEQEITLSGTEYEKRLRKQFEKVYRRPIWAYIKAESQNLGLDKEEQFSFFKASNDIVNENFSTKLLSPDKIDILRVHDANQEEYSQAVIQNVSFHPNGQVLMTSGFDKTLRLFQVDGKINKKIQSVHFQDMPIYSANFFPDGQEVIVTGRRCFFYIYDLNGGEITKIQGVKGHDDKSYERCKVSPCNNYIAFLGTNGYIILLSRKTKQWIADLKINKTVRDIDFSNDGQYIYAIGVDGEVYQWDIGSRSCIHRFSDEGAVKSTTICASRNGEYFATGSNTGVVNIYNNDCLTETKPIPQKSILNLTTSIHNMKFNSDSQLLAISSHSKKDQFKLIHLPTMRVFPNWPTSTTPLSYVSSFDFSPNSGYLAIGNDKGKVLLYRLGSYPRA
jgi:U3 small nucleolar RNA-associated protein 18